MKQIINLLNKTPFWGVFYLSSIYSLIWLYSLYFYVLCLHFSYCNFMSNYYFYVQDSLGWFFLTNPVYLNIIGIVIVLTYFSLTRNQWILDSFNTLQKNRKLMIKIILIMFVTSPSIALLPFTRLSSFVPYQYLYILMSLLSSTAVFFIGFTLLWKILKRIQCK